MSEKKKSKPELPGSRSRVRLRIGKVLVYGMLTALAVNAIMKHTNLWYWTPLTDNRLLKLYALSNDEKNYDILIIGASVSMRAFVPGIMEEELLKTSPENEPRLVYNASLRGTLLPTYLDIMRRIVGKWQKPKVVLMLVEVRTFSGSVKSYINRGVRNFTQKPADMFQVIKYAPKNSTKWSVAGSIFHGLETILQIPAMFSGEYDEMLHDYESRHGSFYHYPFTKGELRHRDTLMSKYKIDIEKRRVSKAKLRRRTILNDFRIDPMIDYWFHEIISEAKKKKVNLVILLYPRSDWLEKLESKEIKLITDYLNDVCKKEGIAWYDLGTEPFRPDNDVYVDDALHLGAQGAEKLSRLVVRHILEPMYKDREAAILSNEKQQ